MKGKVWRSLLGGVALMVGAAGIASAQDSTLPGQGWYTTAVIQNLSTNTAQVVLSAYSATGTSSSALTGQADIAANSNVTFRPDAPGTAGTVGINGLNNNFFGSMVISSLEPLAAVAQLSNTPLASLGTTGGLATANYQGASEGQLKVTYPAAKLRFNKNSTVVYVQSVGGDGTMTATVKTNLPDGKTYSLGGVQVKANLTTVLVLGNLTNSAGATWSATAPAAGCSGSAGSATGSICIGGLTIESSTPVVGTAVEYVVGVAPASQVLSTSTLGTAQASDTLFCPVYKNRFPGNLSGRPTTGITIQNIGSGPATVNVSIKGNATPSTPASGNTYTASFADVAAGAAVVMSPFAANDGGVPGGSISAVTISGPAGSSLVAIANEVSTSASTAQYCSSATGASNTVALPLFKKAFPNLTSASSANSGAVIQNIDTAKITNVSATFTCRAPGQTATTDTTQTVSLNPGAAATIFRNNNIDKAPNPLIPDNTICTVRITATNTDSTPGKIISIVNETTEGLAITQRDSSNYEGFAQ